MDGNKIFIHIYKDLLGVKHEFEQKKSHNIVNPMISSLRFRGPVYGSICGIYVQFISMDTRGQDTFLTRSTSVTFVAVNLTGCNTIQ